VGRPDARVPERVERQVDAVAEHVGPLVAPSRLDHHWRVDAEGARRLPPVVALHDAAVDPLVDGAAGLEQRLGVSQARSNHSRRSESTRSGTASACRIPPS